MKRIEDINEDRLIFEAEYEGLSFEEIKVKLVRRIPKKGDRDKYFYAFTCCHCGGQGLLSVKVFLERDIPICYHCKMSTKMSNLVNSRKEEWVARWQKAIEDKYGVSNVCYSNELQEKKKQTCLEKYGTEYAIGAKEVREKITKVYQEKFNGNSPFCSKEVILKGQETQRQKNRGKLSCQTEETQRKREKTCMERYGMPYGGGTEESMKKRHETNLKKYGVEETLNRKDFREEARKTMLEKYGVEYWAQDKDNQLKSIETLYTRTGHKVPIYKGYHYDGKNFDSSYEIAYYIWLKDHNKQFIYHPVVSITYIGSDGNEHLYLPDFLVEGKFYEIKGDHFFNKDGEPYDPYRKQYWWEKYNTIKENGIIILRDADLKEAFDYVSNTYGKKFLKDCKKKYSQEKEESIEEKMGD